MEQQLLFRIGKIKEAMASVVVGKESVTDFLLSAFLAGGHVLLEDLPGTGKTLLAKTLAGTLDLDFGRVQFTPDLMPSDVTGIHYFNQKECEFQFRPGPVFAGLLLADEINRATPRTQSSLLEAMEEHQVTIDGETRQLPDPFFVIATQNPVESAGTFPLPEAQMDRFLMRLSVGIPGKEEEKEILLRFQHSAEHPFVSLKPVCSREELLKLKKAAEQIYVHPQLMDYLLDLVRATRESGRFGVISGVSPRGSLALLKASKAYALIQGREYVVPEDIKGLAVPVLAHRLVMPKTYGSSALPETVIMKILENVKVPVENWDIPN
ncbi:MAG: AAA family ATPase [Brotaphodocola sp.]